MEKLIELLNEYGKPSCRNKKWGKLDLECADRFYAISKYYGFIKWLVDNDKIDLWKLPKKFEYIQGFGLANRVIMLLSIQDNPIEFLISILK